MTSCGTEGNLHGILVGRENLPDGVLLASRESHYSIWKAAKMYRMDCLKVCNRPARNVRAARITCTVNALWLVISCLPGTHLSVQGTRM